MSLAYWKLHKISKRLVGLLSINQHSAAESFNGNFNGRSRPVLSVKVCCENSNLHGKRCDPGRQVRIQRKISICFAWQRLLSRGRLLEQQERKLPKVENTSSCGLSLFNLNRSKCKVCIISSGLSSLEMGQECWHLRGSIPQHLILLYPSSKSNVAADCKLFRSPLHDSRSWFAAGPDWGVPRV
jgi:hypothetical protein